VKRFLPPLAIALGLVLALAAASLRSAPSESEAQTQVAARAAAPAVPDTEPSSAQVDVESNPTGSVAQEKTQPTDQLVVKTGCGKAVPCPNRDCKDCPLNRYLK